MPARPCILLGAPVDRGARQPGCDMGPSAFRAAGLAAALRDIGCTVEDRGNIVPAPARALTHRNPAVHGLGEMVAWTEAIERAVFEAAGEGMPIVLGGDHAMAAGTLTAVSRRASALARPLFVLWLDAHPDVHTLETTTSGNLHGVPMAYALGLPGFDDFPKVATPLVADHVCMMGVRSVDPAERGVLGTSGIVVHDMREIDEYGVGVLLRRFLERVEAAGGMLHVSLDVDFLDPAIAPGVGTTVPGGATFREAHLIMEMLSDSRLVTSLDLVELNPFLDERGRTAHLMVDLAASLMGRRILDRPSRTRVY